MCSSDLPDGLVYEPCFGGRMEPRFGGRMEVGAPGGRMLEKRRFTLLASARPACRVQARSDVGPGSLASTAFSAGLGEGRAGGAVGDLAAPRRRSAPSTLAGPHGALAQ